MSTSTHTSKTERASGWSGRLTTDQFADLVAAGVEAGCKPLLARLKALEKRSPAGVTWAGVFEEGRSYPEGSLCTRKGGLWLALRDTAAVPGTVPAAWRLVCKEGQAHDR